MTDQEENTQELGEVEEEIVAKPVQVGNLTIVRGLPGSGKTTFAEELAEKPVMIYVPASTSVSNNMS